MDQICVDPYAILKAVLAAGVFGLTVGSVFTYLIMKSK